MSRFMFVTGSLVHGGAERHSITVMNRLSARGHDCHAVYVKNDSSQLDRIQLPPSSLVTCLNAGGYFDLRAIRSFAAHMRRIEPAALIAANAYALMYATLARLLAGSHAPILVTFHSTLLLGIKEQLKMLVDRFFFMSADCLVFVCDNQRRYWRKRGVIAKRNEVIHNGVDLDQFKPDQIQGASQQIRQEFGFTSTDFVVGMVAVLRPEKNHVQLLSAVAALRKRGIPAVALLVGDGVMRPGIEALARLLQIEPYVAITGFRDDVRPYVAACNVVALCSITEALSLAALEAMAMARPVVHSEVGGAAEMISPGYNGFLFPVGDTDILVQKLATLSEPNRALRMGRNSRRLVEKSFSEVGMLDRFEQVLQDLCATRSSATRKNRRHPRFGAAANHEQPSSVKE